MPTDILYPLLIAAGCAALVFVVHLATRQKPTRHDFTMPAGPSRRRLPRRRARAQIVERSPLPVEAEPTSETLLEWHIRYEGTVTALIREGDALALGSGALHEPPVANGDRDLTRAVESHPAPEMRAELAAFRAAAKAMQDALEREDDAAHTRHRTVYLGYRRAWLERLWQFPVDRAELDYLRNRDLSERAD